MRRMNLSNTTHKFSYAAFADVDWGNSLIDNVLQQTCKVMQFFLYLFAAEKQSNLVLND